MSPRTSRPLLAVAALMLVVAAVWVGLSHADALLRHPFVALALIHEQPSQVLPVPVTGVRPSQLTDSWGSPRSGGRKHEGIDIFAPRRRPIVSTTRGLVVTVGNNDLGGRIVRVLGPGGYWHYYAHLDAFGPELEGDVIPAGTLLGYVGDSGNAAGTPTHLHYGIYRLRGGAVNPYPYLCSPRAR